MTRDELLGLLLQATNSPLGIVVSTNDPDRLRQKLYPLRKTDPIFAKLSFIISPTLPEKELYIAVKPETNHGDT